MNGASTRQRWALTLRRPWQVVRAAQLLVAQNAITSLPEITALALRLGFPIEYRPLPKNVSGFFLPIEDAVGVIVINSNRTVLHQHYTVAHELAHGVLHLRPSYALTEYQQDIQADVFAFVCLSLSLSNEADVVPVIVHNLDLVKKVIPILIYVRVGHSLNSLANWLDPQPPQPSHAI